MVEEGHSSPPAGSIRDARLENLPGANTSEIHPHSVDIHRVPFVGSCRPFSA